MFLGVLVSRLVRPMAALATTLALLAASPTVIASPADKATARALATEGIELYNKGECEGAIDLLKRAEQLYSAPVHLLYVARCQDKLGRLIEAAETYRVIKRMNLTADAPEQFAAAVKDADRELKVVTEQIPRLILQVSPEADGLAITINGEDVSAAVVGVERLTNPGEQVVRVTAPGFEPATVTVKLRRSEVRELEVPLLPSGGAAAATAPAGEEAATPGAEVTPEPAAESAPGPNGLIWFVGARLGIMFPGGNVLKAGAPPENIPLSRFAGPGGELEILGGLTIARYFTPFVFFTGYTLDPEDDEETEGKGNNGAMGGAGMRFGTPRRQLGGYGELAFARNVLVMQRTAGPTSCEITASSNSLRLGGGFAIPVSDLFELTPQMAFTFGKFTKVAVSGTGICKVYDAFIPDPLPSENQASYVMLQLGLGGEFVFGGTQ